jgi:hypothetical protein
MELSPIVLFTYKRLEILKQTVEALKNNNLARESELFIFSDASISEKDMNAVENVRKYIKTIDGFKSVTIYEAKFNKGLATSIVEGINQILELHEKVIVLEDDILTSSGFLKYMNDALCYYSSNSEVMQIAGFMFPIESYNLPDTFFYQANTCWGWATWKRAWVHYDNDCTSILQELKLKKISWDSFNSYQGKEFEKQLMRNYRGSLNSWAVKWHASIKINGGKVLHPKVTYVANIGFDGDGENCAIGNVEGSIDNTLELDITVAEKYFADLAIIRLKKYFKKKYSFYERVKRKILSYKLSLFYES